MDPDSGSGAQPIVRSPLGSLGVHPQGVSKGWLQTVSTRGRGLLSLRWVVSKVWATPCRSLKGSRLIPPTSVIRFIPRNPSTPQPLADVAARVARMAQQSQCGDRKEKILQRARGTNQGDDDDGVPPVP